MKLIATLDLSEDFVSEACAGVASVCGDVETERYAAFSIDPPSWIMFLGDPQFYAQLLAEYALIKFADAVMSACRKKPEGTTIKLGISSPSGQVTASLEVGSSELKVADSVRLISECARELEVLLRERDSDNVLSFVVLRTDAGQLVARWFDHRADRWVEHRFDRLEHAAMR